MSSARAACLRPRGSSATSIRAQLPKSRACPADDLAGRRHKASVDFAGLERWDRMTLYQLAGYLHLIGGVGLFVAPGLEWAMIVRIRSAHTVEHARACLSLVAFQRPVGL